MIDENRILELESQLKAYEQVSNADELNHKIDLLNELAWLLSDSDAKWAGTLSEKAYTLASLPENGGQPYQAGMAYSLRTQGYIHSRLGNYPQGLSQLLIAQELCEALQLEDCLIDVLDGISRIHIRVSNYPEALKVGYQQLAAAQRANDRPRLVRAYNKLAAIYYRIGDYERSRETLDLNLQVAEEIGDTSIACTTHVNLSELLLMSDDFEPARQHALAALQLSQTYGYKQFEIYALHRLGHCDMRMGNGAEAVSHLEQAVSLSQALESRATEALVLLTLGMAYTSLQQTERAMECLQQGVAVAQSIDENVEVSRGHKLLSESYEQMGDTAQALAHFKRYHEVKELMMGEEANQRLRVLEVAHETQTAQKEAEIARLRAAQLEQEVSEQKKVEAALQQAHNELEEQVAARTSELSKTVDNLEREIASRKQAEAEIQRMVDQLEQRVADRSRELAALYDMTILFTEPLSLRKVLEPALENINRSVDGSGIAVHILSADYSHLQLTAQLSLSGWEPMQHVSLSPDFADWLEGAESPLMLVKGSEAYPFLPGELRLPAYQVYFCAALRVRQSVIGTLSVYREQPQPFSVQHVSLLITMAEQLGVIIENQRLQEQSLNMTRVIERQRVARELHDSVTQQLYSLNLFAHAGQEAAASGDLAEVQLRLGQVEENALNALREMRLLLYQLRPLALESRSLVAAFEERFDLVERRLGMEAVVQTDFMPVLADDVEEELFYIISEALNNVLKHAQATEVKLHFGSADGQLLVLIQDNGRGFDSHQPYSGLGLENICLRTDKIGGLVELETAPGQGTTIRIRCPGA